MAVHHGHSRTAHSLRGVHTPGRADLRHQAGGESVTVPVADTNAGADDTGADGYPTTHPLAESGAHADTVTDALAHTAPPDWLDRAGRHGGTDDAVARDITMRLIVKVFVPVLCATAACACSKSSPSAGAPLHQSDQLAMAAGVDPRDPERVLPIAPVVAPLRLPSTSPAGAAVTTVFQARPDASCQMQVDYPSSARHQTLPPKVTDDSGRVSWTWVPIHRGRVITRVVCSGGQVVQATIRIV